MGSRGHRDELRADFVELLSVEGRRSVVEAGAGPGTDALAFVDAGIEHVGFDLAVGNAVVAGRKGCIVVPGSIYAPPFRPRCFDAGWMMSTLVHVPDDRFDQAMVPLLELLRPGAPLAVGSWGGIDREFTNETDHFDPPRFFSLRSDDRIQAMLARHAEVESFHSWPQDRGSESYQFAVLRV